MKKIKNLLCITACLLALIALNGCSILAESKPVDPETAQTLEGVAYSLVSQILSQTNDEQFSEYLLNLSPEEYDAALTGGNLPDIVSTKNNLAEILENGLALNAGPYLEEYVPNLLTGEARLTYDVFRQLVNDGDGFYFFPDRIGYNGVGYSNMPYNRGYVVRWDYYKELGYPPINNENDYLNVLQQMYANHPFTEDSSGN